MMAGIFFQSCGDFEDEKLVVINNSAHRIYVTYSEQKSDKGKLSKNPPYPTDGRDNRVSISRRADSLDNRTIWPHTNGHVPLVMQHWEDYLKNDSVTLFILNATVVDSLSWPEIQSRNLYAKKFRLPLDSVEQVNWRITFN